jgi:hypothetical protein
MPRHNVVDSLKIFKVSVPKQFMPAKAPFRYPSYADDWGVEQDFLKYIENSDCLTEDLDIATHIYLPVFWTRYWLNNDFGKKGSSELNNFLNSLNLDQSKLFTVCQYDDGPMTELNFGKGLYLSSRKSEAIGIDIPLLASKLPRLFGKTNKLYQMSFAGRFDTHSIRMDLKERSINNDHIYLANKNLKSREFTKLLHQSLVVLSPRGYGGSSFRFFEAMQAGSVPCLIGDIDTRPFKSQISWESVSFYFKTPAEAIETISKMDRDILIMMGESARRTYHSSLKFGSWNKLLIIDLLYRHKVI